MDTSILKTIIKALSLLAVLFSLNAIRKDEEPFQITYIEADTGKLASPVKAAVISDLHLHEYGENNIDLVTAVKNEQPDLIAVVGDMMNKGNKDYSVVISSCRQLIDIAPVYYVYGNHEYDMVTQQKSKIGTDLQNIGVRLLMNEYETVSINGNLIDIGGIDRIARVSTTDVIQKMETFFESPNYHLLLVHDPGYFDPRCTDDPEISLIGKNIDAAFSGHRHGGQVGIPMVGGLYNPDVGFFPQFTSGDTLVENTHVIVSRGLGDHNKVRRINNPHELLIVTLR